MLGLCLVGKSLLASPCGGADRERPRRRRRNAHQRLRHVRLVRARSLLAGATAIGVAIVVVLVIGASGGAPAPSAVQLMRTALSDANALGSVHVTESETTSSVNATLTNDVATHEGRQNITPSAGEHAEVLIVGGVAYISGNQPVLIHYVGLPAAVASEVGSGWVSIPASSSGYSTVATDATLSSALATLAIRGHLTETAPTTIDGQPVIGIHGEVPIPGSPQTTVAETLYVSRTNSPLPVSATYTYSKGGIATITLSDWGETVALKAPTNAIPESQLAQ